MPDKDLLTFVAARNAVRLALDTIHNAGALAAPAVRDEYRPISDLLIDMDERGKAIWGEDEYCGAVVGAY